MNAKQAHAAHCHKIWLEVRNNPRDTREVADDYEMSLADAKETLRIGYREHCRINEQIEYALDHEIGTEKRLNYEL